MKQVHKLGDKIENNVCEKCEKQFSARSSLKSMF